MMTYRSDHDAALARVDALEAENTRLQRMIQSPGATPPTTRRRYWPIAFVVGLAVSTYTCRRAHVVAPTTDATAPELPYAPDDQAALEGCARSLAAKPLLDAVVADPHGEKLPIEWAARPIGCEIEIKFRLSNTTLPSAERVALEQWQTAEQSFEDEVFSITAYYANDPYATDGYTSAEQRWHKYALAYDARQSAISAWRHAL